MCIGHFEINDIKTTSPTISNGKKVISVTYTILPKIEKWANEFLKISNKIPVAISDSFIKPEKTINFKLDHFYVDRLNKRWDWKILQDEKSSPEMKYMLEKKYWRDASKDY